MIDYDSRALAFSDERVRKFSVLKKDAAGYLQGVVEKPSTEELAQLVDSTGRIGVGMNCFIFEYDLIMPILERVPFTPERDEKEITTAVQLLVSAVPRVMFTIPMAEHVPDLTEISDLQEVQQYLRNAELIPDP